METNWGRFSLVDGMIVIAASAIGMSLAAKASEPDLPRIIWALSAVLYGALIAGPLILASQWIRGRRAVLSPGESLWLSPLVLYLATYAIGLIPSVPGVVVVLLWVAVQVILSVIAFCWLIVGYVAKRPTVECRWTDSLGSSVCAAAGPVLAIVINDGLNRL